MDYKVINWCHIEPSAGEAKMAVETLHTGEPVEIYSGGQLALTVRQISKTSGVLGTRRFFVRTNKYFIQ